ncbi:MULTISPECIES: adenylate/guanylate cyclase domain-containing protein [Spirulina sp. CCY15215]|uniref:adenylate/guanylate cyclase domain-containing protein n=1 Tax=Spirulina sp. CCY15215 TaxID=2767591 RepID=UPI00194F950D|nr:adenylate/guanylate cyclase domain-containing protein [Spirulina major]
MRLKEPKSQNFSQNFSQWWKFLQPKVLGAVLAGFWVSVGAIATVWDGNPVQWLEGQIRTQFFVFRGSIAAPEDIIIVAIDDDSLKAAETFQGSPNAEKITQLLPNFPWPREAYAEAIDRLMKAGAKTISLDLLFDLPSGYGIEDDRKLKQSLEKYAGKITLATAYLEVFLEEGTSFQLAEPNPDLKTESLSLGFADFILDADDRVHHLGRVYRENIVRPLGLPISPSFAEATVQIYRDNNILAQNSSQVEGQKERKGEGIFYWGDRFESFRYISFWRILEEKEWQRLQEEEMFKDKIVLIGATASTLHDFKATPFSLQMPGVEIHAHAIATLLQDKAIVEILPNLKFRGVFFFLSISAIAIALWLLTQYSLRQLSAGIAIAIAWIGISYGLFTYAQIAIPTAIPGIIILLCSGSYFAISVVHNNLEKLFLQTTLERYVAQPVAKEILKNPENFYSMVQGKKIKVAVLFSDIRGFTTLSFLLPPEDLIAQLNIYFHEMVEAIVSVEGTLDKFIGDAVMAEFGFPLSRGEKQDALNAIYAALAMRKNLAKLRSSWQETGRIPLFNGIGISYGEAIAGDIGSWRRREYAVMGDTVNVASRVEGLTKKLKTDILISESLYNIVRDDIEAIDLGEHPLKGRESDLIRLYGVIGLKGCDRSFYDRVQADLKNYLK